MSSLLKGSYLAFKFLQVNGSSLSEVETLLRDLEAVNQAVLHPLVVIWVSSHMDTAVMVSQRRQENSLQPTCWRLFEAVRRHSSALMLTMRTVLNNMGFSLTTVEK